MGFPKQKQDLAPELLDSIVSDVCQQIAENFERALLCMPEADRQLLMQHFDGQTDLQLRQAYGLNAEELAAWLWRSKRALLHLLKIQARTRGRIRQ